MTDNCSLTGGNLTGCGSLTVQQDFNWTNGTVLSYYPLSANGPAMTFKIESDGTLNMTGDPEEGLGSTNVGFNCTLVNKGIVNWTGSGSYDYVGLLGVNNYGTFLAQGSGVFLAGMALGFNNNFGTFEYAPSQPAQATLSTRFTNQGGKLKVDNGMLYVPFGASVDGETTIAPGATLAVNQFSCDADSTIEGIGATMTFQGIAGGTATIDCPYEVTTTNILGPGGTVLFNAGGTTVDATLAGGILSGEGDFTITSSLTWTGGEMAGDGTTIIPAGAQVTINSTSFVRLELDRTLNNEGQITWSGSAGGFMKGTGTIENNGTFTKTNTSTAALNVLLNNSGTVNVQGGALLFGNGGETISGTFNIAQDAALGFSGGNYNLSTDISTTGTMVFAGGTVTVCGSLSAGTLDVIGGSVSFQSSAETTSGLLLGGTINNAATFTIDGDFDWEAGALQGGSINVTECATLNIDDIGLGLSMGGGVVLNNEGAITASGSSILTLNTGTATINNAGTFNATGEEMYVGVPFNNNSMVAVQSGDLTLAGGGQSTGGTFQLSDNASLTFAGAGSVSYTIDSASNFTLAAGSSQGLVIFSGGNTIIACPLDLYQIVIDGGTAILNGATSVNQLLLSYGTLSGVGAVTVLGTFDWTGGTMTSSAGSTATITIDSCADWFVFGDNRQRASNRTIDQEGDAYLFDNALVTFQGGVTMTNAGTFTAYDAVRVTGTGSDSFSNSGTFNCGGADGGACVLALPFANTGQVNVQSGTLTLQSGSSTCSGMSISASAALILAGGGSGNSAQVFVFTGGGVVNGVIIVDGAGAGGLGVQNAGDQFWQTAANALNISQLYLVAGTISGYGKLIVTDQMVWSGGTMTTAAVSGTGPLAGQTYYGSLTIAKGAALFVEGMAEGDGDQQTLVLARPLNIVGYVGWIGSDGSINVNLNRTDATTFTNTEAQFTKGLRNNIPVPDDWGSLPGGYGNAVEMARILHTVLQYPGNSVDLSDSSWKSTIAVIKFGDTVSGFFEELPAIERASLDAAFSSMYGMSLSAYIRGNPQIKVAQQDSNCNALLTGNRLTVEQQFELATPLQYLEMAGGLIVGLVQGAFNQIAGFPTLLYQLVMNTSETVNAISTGLQELWTQMTASKDFVEAAQKVFPAFFPSLNTAYQLYKAAYLVSYEGGVAVGQMLAGVVSYVLGISYAGVAKNLITGIASYMINKITAAMPKVARAAGVAATGIARVTKVGVQYATITAKASAKLVVAMGQSAATAASALGKQLAAPFNAVWRRRGTVQSIKRIRIASTFDDVTPLLSGELSAAQADLLARLSTAGGRLTLRRGEITTTDIAALTLHTRLEFAVVRTQGRGGPRQLIMLGRMGGNLPEDTYRLIIHSHPGGINAIRNGVSDSDVLALAMLGQSRSYIVNSQGTVAFFGLSGEPFIVKQYLFGGWRY